MASALIWQWYQTSKQQGDVIVVSATTKHAIQNAARAFLKLVDKLPKGTVVFLQSVAAELQEVTVEDASWCNCRLSELLNELLEKTGDTMENSEKRAIHEYVKKRIGHNGEAFGEQ